MSAPNDENLQHEKIWYHQNECRKMQWFYPVVHLARLTKLLKRKTAVTILQVAPDEVKVTKKDLSFDTCDEKKDRSLDKNKEKTKELGEATAVSTA